MCLQDTYPDLWRVSNLYLCYFNIPRSHIGNILSERPVMDPLGWGRGKGPWPPTPSPIKISHKNGIDFMFLGSPYPAAESGTEGKNKMWRALFLVWNTAIIFTSIIFSQSTESFSWCRVEDILNKIEWWLNILCFISFKPIVFLSPPHPPLTFNSEWIFRL